MEVILASAELKEGNVLSFRVFPTQPYPLALILSLHVTGEVTGEIAYRVRKRDDVIYQTAPLPFHATPAEGEMIWSFTATIEPAFPSQGSYRLEMYFDESLICSLPFSVFDSSKRAELEREIIYYLRRKRGAKSVQEITRGVFNPGVVNKANIRELSGRVYLALLRMQEVTNTNPGQQGSLEDKMNSSRWQLKD